MGAVQSVRAFASAHPLALIVALGAVIRFATIGGQGFWLDEQVTVSLDPAGPDRPAAVGDRHGESNPSLYYLARRRLGASLRQQRVRDPLALGARRNGGDPGALRGSEGAVLPPRRADCRGAHGDEPAADLVLAGGAQLRAVGALRRLSFLCFAEALDERSGHRWLWGWALVSALALATHYFAFFLIVGEALWLLSRRVGPRLDTAIPMGADRGCRRSPCCRSSPRSEVAATGSQTTRSRRACSTCPSTSSSAIRSRGRPCPWSRSRS